MAPRVVLLGPQRVAPSVAPALDALGVDGPVAAVTAGWEEREAEVQELADHVRRPVIATRVFERCETVWREDPELHAAMRARHDRQRALQELHRARLAHALDAARELFAAQGEDELLEGERRDALEALRALDRHQEARVAELHARFEERLRPRERLALVRQREELARELEPARVLCIAGGHVAILLNRMRVLGLLDLWGAERPVVAWSAGAMALAERVVLFHDSPPQGAGDAELLGPGLGLHRGLVALPHGERRLRLEDRARVALFARRFAPARCAVLGRGTRLEFDGERWMGLESARVLAESGAVEAAA